MARFEKLGLEIELEVMNCVGLELVAIHDTNTPSERRRVQKV